MKFQFLKSEWWDSKGAKEGKSYRSRQELSSEYLVAKIAFDIAENEPRRVWITDLSDHIVRPKAERLVDDALDVFSIAARGMCIDSSSPPTSQSLQKLEDCILESGLQRRSEKRLQDNKCLRDEK